MAGRLALGVPIATLERIAQALSETPASSREIATLTGISPRTVARVLPLLVDRGRASLSIRRSRWSSFLASFYSKPPHAATPPNRDAHAP